MKVEVLVYGVFLRVLPNPTSVARPDPASAMLQGRFFKKRRPSPQPLHQLIRLFITLF
jgi:hypothetical protein